MMWSHVVFALKSNGKSVIGHKDMRYLVFHKIPNYVFYKHLFPPDLSLSHFFNPKDWHKWNTSSEFTVPVKSDEAVTR